MKEVLKMSEKQMKILGWVATFMSVMMYVSYFPQIMNNLAGQKEISSSPWLLPSTVVSGFTTVFSRKKEIFLAAANAPGIVFGLVTAITALI